MTAFVQEFWLPIVLAVALVILGWRHLLVLRAAGKTARGGESRNASEQKKLEISPEMTAGLGQALDAISEGFVYFDRYGKLAWYNEKYLELHADSADLLVPGTSFETIIRNSAERGHFEVAASGRDAWVQDRLNDHQASASVVEQRLGNGKWIRVAKRKTKDGGSVRIHSDITDFKQREDELKTSSARLEATMVTSLDAIVVIDVQGLILEYNPAAESIFGYTREEAIGREMAELIVPEKYREAHRAGLERMAKTGEAHIIGQRIEIEALHADGREFPIEVAIAKAEETSGAAFVGFIRDITDRKQVEDTLREARERAEVANKAKSQFLAMMSHEIRTPLNAVMGVLSLLTNMSLNRKQTDLIHTARESADSLLMIISDILDYSKIEAGMLNFEATEIRLPDLVESALALMDTTAKANNVETSIDIAPDLPVAVNTDPGRLRQILLNMISNAVKFSEGGKVDVRVSVADTTDEITRFRFDVRDTGCGIPADRQSDIFQEFITVDSSYTRKFGGTGLGLAITKQLVEMMDGEIGFESEEGKGSHFWVIMPLEVVSLELVDRNRKERKVSTAGARARVLLVEDNNTNRMIARTMLENAGHTVDVAANGLEAVRAAVKFSYDIILMDISMPEMDGHQATREIRKHSNLAPDVPIVAMTAHAFQEDREAALEAGMNDYLVKPIRPDELMSVVEQWISGRADSGQSPMPEEGKAMTKVMAKATATADHPLIDRVILAELAADTSYDLLAELINLFIEENQGRVDEYLAAPADAKMLEAWAHSLGSSAGTYGALALSELAREVEGLCRTGNVEAAFERASKLPEMMQHSAAELRLAGEQLLADHQS
jgi:PAS domain S-box-containing protein